LVTNLDLIGNPERVPNLQRSLRSAKPPYARPEYNVECIATFSVAIRRLQGRDCSFDERSRSPLTLDCFVRKPLALASNDVLKTRFRVVVLYLFFTEPTAALSAAKGRESYLGSHPPSRLLLTEPGGA